MGARQSRIDQIADLLAHPQSTRPDFFFRLARAMLLRGYTLQAQQRGISGTHIVLIRNPGTPDRTLVGQYEQD